MELRIGCNGSVPVDMDIYCRPAKTPEQQECNADTTYRSQWVDSVALIVRQTLKADTVPVTLLDLLARDCKVQYNHVHRRVNDHIQTAKLFNRRLNFPHILRFDDTICTQTNNSRCSFKSVSNMCLHSDPGPEESWGLVPRHGQVVEGGHGQESGETQESPSAEAGDDGTLDVVTEFGHVTASCSPSCSWLTISLDPQDS